jgi:hypothetical protein
MLGIIVLLLHWQRRYRGDPGRRASHGSCDVPLTPLRTAAASTPRGDLHTGPASASGAQRGVIIARCEWRFAIDRGCFATS